MFACLIALRVSTTPCCKLSSTAVTAITSKSVSIFLAWFLIWSSLFLFELLKIVCYSSIHFKYSWEFWSIFLYAITRVLNPCSEYSLETFI
jgi:hypothetical protein